MERPAGPALRGFENPPGKPRAGASGHAHRQASHPPKRDPPVPTGGFPEFARQTTSNSPSTTAVEMRTNHQASRERERADTHITGRRIHSNPIPRFPPGAFQNSPGKPRVIRQAQREQKWVPNARQAASGSERTRTLPGVVSTQTRSPGFHRGLSRLHQANHE